MKNYIDNINLQCVHLRTLQKLLFLLLPLMFLICCSDFVEIGPPKTKLISSTVYTNDFDATAAIKGLYHSMMNNVNFASGGTSSISFLCGLSCDEFDSYSANIDYSAFFANELTPSNFFIGQNWNQMFKIVYNANSVIEGLSNSNGVTDSIKKQLIGEAKFMRAFCYFYLVNLWGDVPLITSTDYRINSIAFRSSKEQVYDQIILDLRDAQDHLSSDYSFSNGEKVRPNTWAATALLARVYLYNQDWDDAEKEASKVINSGVYSLPNDLNTIFLKNSTEAIWQLLPISAGINTNEGFNFILTSTPSYVVISNNFINEFEFGDGRLNSWVGSFSNSIGTWSYPNKYKVKMGDAPINEYSMVLRLAEQYLIRAEALAQMNKLPEAISDIDFIRKRAGLALIQNTNPSIDQSSLLDVIEHEKRIEFFSEWGHRWLDLKRWNSADNVLISIKGTTWNSTDVLYPVPQLELDRDKNLSQNDGY